MSYNTDVSKHAGRSYCNTYAFAQYDFYHKNRILVDEDTQQYQPFSAVVQPAVNLPAQPLAEILIHGPDPARDNMLRIHKWIQEQPCVDGINRMHRAALRNDGNLHMHTNGNSVLAVTIIQSREGVVQHDCGLRDYKAFEVGLSDAYWLWFLYSHVPNPTLDRAPRKKPRTLDQDEETTEITHASRGKKRQSKFKVTQKSYQSPIVLTGTSSIEDRTAGGPGISSGNNAGGSSRDLSEPTMGSRNITPDDLSGPDMRAQGIFAGWHENDYSTVQRPVGHHHPIYNSWVNHQSENYQRSPSLTPQPVISVPSDRIFENVPSRPELGHFQRLTYIPAVDAAPSTDAAQSFGATATVAPRLPAATTAAYTGRQGIQSDVYNYNVEDFSRIQGRPVEQWLSSLEATMASRPDRSSLEAEEEAEP